MNSMAGLDCKLQAWQKQKLVKMQFVGEAPHVGVAVGRGTAAGPLPGGVERRLHSLMQVICAPSKDALRGEYVCAAQLDAAAWLLLQLFLEASLAKYDVGVEEAQVRARCQRMGLNEAGSANVGSKLTSLTDMRVALTRCNAVLAFCHDPGLLERLRCQVLDR
jgi:hypothetical protein